MSLFDRIPEPAFEAYRAVFELDGVVCVRDVFDGDAVARLRATVDDAVAAPSGHIEYFGAAEGKGRFFADVGLARFASYEAFLRELPAAELAARLMRSSVARLFFEQILVKEAGAEQRTPWHQDLPYWPIAGTQVCSIWIPVEKLAKQVSVEFVAGSHRWPEHSPRDFHCGTDYGHAGLPRLRDIDAERDKHRVLAFAMSPGDCLVFHAKTAHGAPGNDGSIPRRAVSIRWAGDDVRHRHRLAAEGHRNVGSEEREGMPLDDVDYPVLWSASADGAGFRRARD